MSQSNNKRYAIRVEIINYKICKSIIMTYIIKDMPYMKAHNLIKLLISKDIPKNIRKQFGNIGDYKINEKAYEITYTKGSHNDSIKKYSDFIFEFSIGYKLGRPYSTVYLQDDVKLELDDPSIQ